MDYSTRPTEGLLIGDGADTTLEQTLREACDDAKLAPDGRLAQLALAVAESTGVAQRAPQVAVVSHYARRVGLIDPTPQLWLASASSLDLLLSPLREAVAHAVQAEPLTHCGGAALRMGDILVVGLAFSRRQVELSGAIPRTLPLGGSVVLAGELARGHDDATLAITPPHGEVKRITLAKGRKFRHALSFAQRGEHMVELLAVGPSGVTVVAMFPITVGQKESQSAPRLETFVPERDARAVSEGLLSLIAAERKRRKLPPLSVDAKLTRVAEGHSNDMLANRFVAHTSPTTGEAIDRVDQSGLDVSLLLENIGRGYSAAEIHAGLMESPGHRANILNPDVRLIGIGVVAEQEGLRQAFLATQVFAQLMEPLPKKRRR